MKIYFRSLRQDKWYLGIIFFVITHISQNKSFNIPLSNSLAKRAHILNVYTRYVSIPQPIWIFNMQDYRNVLWSSMMDLFWSGGIPTMGVSARLRTILQGGPQLNRTQILIESDVWSQQTTPHHPAFSLPTSLLGCVSIVSKIISVTM